MNTDISAAAGGVSAAGDLARSRERPLGIWLLCVAALVFAMVLLGGATRLTHSGLSMVEWQPLMGVLPPLDEAEWQETFAKYQQYPEYQKINRGMSLAEFKRIFYFEYAHRVLGRAIGLSFALPFLWFLWRRAIARRHIPVLLGLFVLGGLQGVVGWWMVKSGLVDRPDVSHFRLTVHLGLAAAIFAALIWVAFGYLSDAGARARARGGRHGRLARWTGLVLLLVFAQLLSGGLVAGLDAGMVYNSFPMMNAHWLPPELGQLSPLWRDLVDNPVTVQFSHRIGAYLTLLAVVALWWQGRRLAAPQASLAYHLVLAAVVLQFALGVATLLTVVALPLGVAHQGGAMLLIASLVFALHRVRHGLT